MKFPRFGGRRLFQWQKTTLTLKSSLKGLYHFLFPRRVRPVSLVDLFGTNSHPFLRQWSSKSVECFLRSSFSSLYRLFFRTFPPLVLNSFLLLLLSSADSGPSSFSGPPTTPSATQCLLSISVSLIVSRPIRLIWVKVWSCYGEIYNFQIHLRRCE